MLENNCRFKSFIQYPMKRSKTILFLLVFAAYSCCISSCSPKYGCPSNGKNVGAERILSGEKVQKAPKFKA
jgi:hypothetical protein